MELPGWDTAGAQQHCFWDESACEGSHLLTANLGAASESAITGEPGQGGGTKQAGPQALRPPSQPRQCPDTGR